MLLGSLMADSTMYHLIDGLLTAESFYTSQHKLIYAAIGKLVKDDAPVDIVTLRSILNDKVSTTDLMAIGAATPTGANAEYHAGVVADKHSRRVAIDAMRMAIEKAQGHDDIVDVIATVQRELDSTLPRSTEISDIFPDIVTTMERVIDFKRENYLSTGFEKMDTHASLRPGNLTLIAADPGAGKTSYLLCMARHITKQGKRPLIFTLEMTREQILENLIAQELKICHQDMVNGKLTGQQVELMTRKAKDFEKLNMGVVGGRGWTTGKIRHKAITEARTKGVSCIMVDSLTKIQLPKDAGKYATRLADVYNLMLGDMVDLADELNVPVIVTHHLNKDSGKRGDKNRPTLQSLREAGDMWTHNVILIYREYLHTKESSVENDAHFIIAKARDGRVGTVEAWFDGPTKTFTEKRDNERTENIAKTMAK